MSSLKKERVHFSEPMSLMERRHFLTIMSASIALAGLNGCTRQPIEQILPYVKQPENLIPGQPLYFATAMVLNGFATGILAESHEGRPTKIEGNPQHPFSLGSTSVFEQAAILEFYDPDRSQNVMRTGRISNWDRFLSELVPILEKQKTTQGAGLRILTETISSPTLVDQLENLLTQYPRARWCQYDPVNRDAVYEGAKLALGQPAETHYEWDRAKVIVSLDADFLFYHPARLRNTRLFSRQRNVASQKKVEMSRLYAVESSFTLTGAMADHRLPLPSTRMEHFTYALILALRGRPLFGNEFLADPTIEVWLKTLAKELLDHRGESIVVASCFQSPQTHAYVHWINEYLGNLNRTIFYASPIHKSEDIESLGEVVAEIHSRKVDTLIILEGNPAFNAPADYDFASALLTVENTIHLSAYYNETSARCQWHIPATHFLESWGDARAYDGTVSLIQPLILPLYQGKSAHSLVAYVSQSEITDSYELVRSFWKKKNIWPNFEKGWRRALHDGIIEGTRLVSKNFPIQFEPTAPISSSLPLSEKNIEINFRPDPMLWDGRFANNAWLQEIPKPFTKVTWDNPLLISSHLAKKLNLQNEDVVELKLNDRNLRAAIFIMPGQADYAATFYLGSGRSRAGRVGNQVGWNAYTLRTSHALWTETGLILNKTQKQYPLAVTQSHHRMEGRNLLRAGTLAYFMGNPNFAQELSETPSPDTTLYHFKTSRSEEYAWGMVINLTTCIGCNACVIACQAENNIPVVGKGQVIAGREMHWIRVDSYYRGELKNPKAEHQPVPCMHCEHAPCEVVCPVEATLHNAEGLNEQIYNRCVGTRYCSNNCPYKVRRFNFFHYADIREPSLRLMQNPDVTVRWRGVMEKCTYCVQRINQARIAAKKEYRPIRDGEIVPACAQVCPAEAIVFGNGNDSEALVSKLKKHSLNYGMLEELNTRPRTTYLAQLKNPNPLLLQTEPRYESGN
ncbi:MAG: 4Fe-4S dicluster domain-containing protein [Verrucomicrobiae bacterium]|nr:4Fe-4S dicluster domain-containing protein [Verrucomicrobiae bacterium]